MPDETAVTPVPPQLSTYDTMQILFARPDLMADICEHISAGGDLITLCETWRVPYGKIIRWVDEDPERQKAHMKALKNRNEWYMESVLSEVKRMSKADVRTLFHEDGRLKLPHEWDEATAKCVASIEVDELFEGAGKERAQVGWTKKIKLWDKLKANELMGKHLAMWIERHKHEVTNLEDLIMASHNKKEEE